VREAREGLYRNLILEAAERTFAEQGVEGSKMEAIAKLAGLSLGTVYSVFGGKGDIVDALHEARLRDMMVRTTDAAAGTSDPIALTLAGVRAYVEYFVDHPDYLRMYIDDGTNWGIRALGASTTDRGQAWEEGLSRQVKLFERGQRAGRIRPGDADRMARMMFSMQQVQMACWLEGGRRQSVDELVAEMEEQVRRSFCTDA
jgi:AcrR family transcriptional regulator